MNLFRIGHIDFVQIVQCKIDIQPAMKQFSSRTHRQQMQFKRAGAMERSFFSHRAQRLLAGIFLFFFLWI